MRLHKQNEFLIPKTSYIDTREVIVNKLLPCCQCSSFPTHDFITTGDILSPLRYIRTQPSWRTKRFLFTAFLVLSAEPVEALAEPVEALAERSTCLWELKTVNRKSSSITRLSIRFFHLFKLIKT